MRETDEAEAFRLPDLFVDRGGTLVDTADVYAGGASEEIIGRAVAERHGRPPAQVAIAWLAARPGVAPVLLGARQAGQLAERPGAADLVLEPADLAELNAVSAPGLPAYPHGFVQNGSGVEVWRCLGT